MPFDESTGYTPPAAFGPYRVLHQIGSGVFGPVFRTYDPQQDRLVAVKAFRLDVVPETVAKLAGNLRKLPASGLSNPAVVQVVDAGLEGMSAYLAMEYVSAETLDVALRHLAPAPLDRALPILTDLAKAVEAAWAAGCGHGAIHPRDVFVLSGTNEVRLSGCGVVPALEGAGIKVPPRRPYSAPERGTAESWDIRADIYSLGVLAHELLTKRRPAGAHEQDGSLVTGTSPEARVMIRKVLAAALAERPDQRFATPTAFVEALGHISRGEPVGTLPEGANVPDERPAPPAKKVPEPPPLLAMAEREPAPEPVLEAAPESEDEAESDEPTGPPVWAPLDTPVEAHELPAVEPAAAEPVAPVAAAASVEVPVPVAPRKVASAGATRPSTGDRTIPNDRVDRPAPVPRPSPPPLRVSPPPVIVPMRVAYPWLAVLAAALAGLAVGGVGGYRWGYRTGFTTHPPSAAADSAVPSAAPGAGTDVQVPQPLTPGGVPSAPQTPPPAQPTTAAESPAAPPTTATHAAPETAHAPAHASASAKTTTPGSLLVETRPEGARVVLDGKSLGVTPLTLPDVRTGQHGLRLERDGYKTLVTIATIKAGERTRIAVTLELSGVLDSWMPRSR